MLIILLHLDKTKQKHSQNYHNESRAPQKIQTNLMWFVFYTILGIIYLMKKIAIIIAFKDFRDEEYFQTKEILENNGFKTKTFSNEKGIAVGRFGGEVKIEETIDSLDINNFDAIIFVGGSGAIQFLDNETSYNLAREAHNANKLIAGICIAPVILAKAKILDNKKATVWSSSMDKSAIKTLKECNVIFIDKPVVTDNNIITASGPEAINEFSNEIVDKLSKIDIIKQ